MSLLNMNEDAQTLALAVTVLTRECKLNLEQTLEVFEDLYNRGLEQGDHYDVDKTVLREVILKGL